MKSQVPTSLALVFGVALAISVPPRTLAGQDAEPTAQRGYPMYTPRLGYPEGDITWKAGRSVGGAPIGILQFLADIPMQPGNVGNAGTFDFPVIYRQVEDIDVEALVEGRSSEEDLSKFIAAAKDLEAQGVRAIAANCGFWANWQKEISEAVEVPFVSSSLTQLPMLLNLLPKSKKVMVLTFSEELMMSVPALPAVGVDDTSRLVVVSVGETSEEFVRIGGMEGAFNPKEFERDLVEIARKTLEENPDIGAILQECTEMTPFSWAVQEATGLPVFDSITPIKWMYSGVVQRPYYGHL